MSLTPRSTVLCQVCCPDKRAALASKPPAILPVMSGSGYDAVVDADDEVRIQRGDGP